MKSSRREMVGLSVPLMLAASSEMGPLRRVREGEPSTKSGWRCVYQLDEKRHPVSGSHKELGSAVRRGADLRIYTEFRHNEHIDTASKSKELIREVADFRVTYLVENRWVAGIMTLRQPIDLPVGFGQRPSMSFFMYNQDGQQAIARPYLDGAPVTGKPGPSPLEDHRAMPKYRQLDGWDAQTNAPSSNFIYAFNTYKFWVRDEWEEVLAHDSDGKVLSGSVQTLADRFSAGCEVKVAIRGLCADLSENSSDHEIFVQTGSGYYYTEQKLFIAATHPLVRVKPAIPMRYESRGWDFGWVMVRTDGLVARWLVDPYHLKFRRSEKQYAIRWFVR